MSDTIIPGPVTLVQDFIEHTARRLPGKIALVSSGVRFTYGELDARANQLANALVGLGVRRGDRVAVFLNNSVEAIVGIFAILKAGGVFVVINSTTKQNKLQYILNDCGAVVVIAEGRSFIPALATSGDVISLRSAILVGGENFSDSRLHPWDALLDRQATSAPARHNIDLDLACLIYTSGTTGEPKGVMSDHGNVVFASGSIIHYLQNREDDIVLNVLPVSFDYGLYQVLMTFRFGGTLILEKSFAFPAAILKLMEQERVTGFPGVPTMFAVLSKMDLKPFDLSSLRYITNTAAALPSSHIQELRAKFPMAQLFSMYGLTETKRTLYLPPSFLDDKPDSVGIPIPGTEAWVEDESGRRLPPGEVGELVVRGRHVMRGYWRAPELTAKRYRPGPMGDERVCYSGDLFRTDEEGFFYFVGRKDDIIKSRGEKVAPKEVETVLCALPGVRQAAVIGVADPILGQAVKAFVVTDDPSLNTNRVLAHCKANLEEFMVPKLVEFHDSLPLSPNGKIDKKELN